MRSWLKRRFRRPDLCMDPRGEPPNPGIFDECFSPVLVWKRDAWRRWHKLGLGQRVFELARFRLRRAGQWIWWLVRFQCKPPGLADFGKWALPMISEHRLGMMLEDIVSAQSMTAPTQIQIGVDHASGKDESVVKVFEKEE